MIGPRASKALAAPLALLVLSATTAHAAPPSFDIRGTWQGAAGSDGTRGSVTFETEDCVTGAITGRGSSPTDSWSASGRIDGGTVSLAFGGFAKDRTYGASGTGTLRDANHISGTFRDTEDYKDKDGTFDLTRTSGPPQDGQGCGPRGTVTTVSCTYEVATGVNTCTASTADTGAPPRVTPTGTVAFTSTSGGVFVAGDTCTLAPTPLSPGAASCAVLQRPPSADLPAITAAYAGDERHSASSGTATLLTLGGPPQEEDAFPGEAECPAGGATSSEKKPSKPQPPAAKACAFLGVGAGIFVIWVGTALEGTVVGIPLGLIVIGLGVAVVIHQGTILKDPPDERWSQLALPPAKPMAKVPAAQRCPRATAKACAALRPRASAYAASLGAVYQSGVALAVSGNRLTGALAAGDATAIGLQTAAVKLYAGRYAAAVTEADQRAARFGRALRRAGVDRRVAPADLDRAIARMTRRPGPAVLDTLALVGKTPADLAAALRTARARTRGAGRPYLSSLLMRRTPVGGYRTDHRSMTLENLRALVRGMARQGLVATPTADTLLADLTCDPTHPAPRMAAFAAHARSGAPRVPAGLLATAAAPLRTTTGCGG